REDAGPGGQGGEPRGAVAETTAVALPGRGRSRPVAHRGQDGRRVARPAQGTGGGRGPADPLPAPAGHPVRDRGRAGAGREASAAPAEEAIVLLRTGGDSRRRGSAVPGGRRPRCPHTAGKGADRCGGTSTGGSGSRPGTPG